jgi:hypothetical protein
MKKTLLFFSLFSLISVRVLLAQCTPDVSQTVPGFSPDSLPPACVGEAYDQTVTLVFANDTTISTPLGNVTIDFLSYRITGITNLPPGITYACDDDSCEWLITQSQINRGCVRFSGTPTTASNDTMFVSVLANLNTTLVPPTTIPVPTPFTVKAAGQCATSSSRLLNASLVKIYPNPGAFNFKVECPQGAEIIEVSDLTGKIIYHYVESQSFVQHTVPASDWHTGMYFVKVKGSNGEQTVRWIRQ